MSVPSTAYYNNDNTHAVIHKVAVASRSLKHPVLAVAYPTPEIFKQIFHVDYLLKILAKTTDGVTEQEMLIAGVIPGSANANMRSSSRLHGFKGAQTSNNITFSKTMILLNDGGLHTKGTAAVLQILDNIFSSFTARFNFKSAFYLNSTDYGFVYRWRNDANTAWESWNYVSLSGNGQVPANDNITLENLVPINRPTTELILAELKAYFTNEEGTFESPSQILYPRLKPILLQLNGWNNNPTTYYINDDEIIAGGNESSLTGLWANNDMSGGRYTVTMQLWKDGRYYYTYGYNVPEDVWCFLSLVDSDPPDPEPTYNIYEFVFFKSDTSLTVEQINDEMMFSPTGPGWISGTIYNPLPPSPNTDKWYTTDSMVTLVSNGWYCRGNYAIGLTKAFKIISGVVVEEYDYE